MHDGNLGKRYLLLICFKLPNFQNDDNFLQLITNHAMLNLYTMNQTSSMKRLFKVQSNRNI